MSGLFWLSAGLFYLRRVVDDEAGGAADQSDTEKTALEGEDASLIESAQRSYVYFLFRVLTGLLLSFIPAAGLLRKLFTWQILPHTSRKTMLLRGRECAIFWVSPLHHSESIIRCVV